MTQNVQMWNVPNRISFGRGATAEIGSYFRRFGAERPLVVTDENVRSAGALDPVLASLTEAGIDYAVFDGVVPDPTDTVVHEAARTYAEAEADAIVGVGGGSSIDTAKAASVVATNEGNILDYEGSDNVEEATPPTVYAPTTAGSGSEVGNWCIVRDSETDIKEEIGDVKLLADVAVVDPALTETAPPSVKAATGMDVLTHAVEAYVSINAQRQCSALAVDAIETVGQHLPRAVGYRGDNDEHLGRMARASSQAGMAFNGAGLGAVHAISHQIGGQFRVPHGLANAILLPYVMEYNLPQVPELLVDVAEALGEAVSQSEPARQEAYKSVRAVRSLANAIDIPRTLADTKAEPEAVSDLAADALNDGSLTGNPRTTTQREIETILERAFDGTLLYENRL